MKRIIGILCIIAVVCSTTIYGFAASNDISPYYEGCREHLSKLVQEGSLVKASVEVEGKSSSSYDSVKIYARLQQVSTGETVKTWNSIMKKSGTSFNWSGTYTTYSSTTYRLKVSCSGYKDGKLVETITLKDVTLKTT